MTAENKQGVIAVVASAAPAISSRTVMRGVIQLLSRSMVARLTGLVSSIFLARLLVPDEFGRAAVAMSIANIAVFFLDSGLAAAALRSAEEPSLALLRGISGLQLAISLVTATLGSAIAFLTSHAALTIVALAILPILSVQTPLLIVAERRLDFKHVSNAELAGNLASQAATLALAAAGAGVWSLIIGILVKPLTNGIWLAGRSDRHLLMPSHRIAVAFPLFRDALRLQLMPASIILRDQGSTLIAATAVGTTALGVWVLVGRLLSVPAAVYTVLGRVAYPTMSAQSRAGTIDPGQLQRAMRRIAIMSAWLLSMTCAGALFAVPLVFGEAWSSASAALIAVCPGMLIGTAVATPTTSLLMIERRVVAPTVGVALNGMITWAIISSGVLGQGATTIGAATSIGTTIEVGVLLWLLDQRGLAWLLSVRAFLGPLLIATASVGCAVLAGAWLPPLLASFVAPLAALVVLTTASLTFFAEDLRMLAGHLRRDQREEPKLEGQELDLDTDPAS